MRIASAPARHQWVIVRSSALAVLLLISYLAGCCDLPASGDDHHTAVAAVATSHSHAQDVRCGDHEQHHEPAHGPAIGPVPPQTTDWIHGKVVPARGSAAHPVAAENPESVCVRTADLRRPISSGRDLLIALSVARP